MTLTFFISIAVFALAMTGLAVGVMIAKKPLKGSCGGLNNLSTKDGKSYCDICGADGSASNDFCGPDEDRANKA